MADLNAQELDMHLDLCFQNRNSDAEFFGM